MKNALPGSVSAATDEARRLAMLQSLRILDTPPEAEFETIIDCAQRLFGCKIALLSLIDRDRQWFKAKAGLGASETPRAHSFCAHAIRGEDLFVIPDATRDARFADNPLVTGAPEIRFYAGVPIRVEDPQARDGSYPMGTVCVIDDRPRTLSADEENVLRKLGKLAEALLSARALALQATRVAEERRVALHDLDITHRQFRQAERMANIGSWRLTLADNHTDWSDQVFVIHELPPGERPSVDEALAFYPPHARAELAGALTRTIETGDPFSVEVDFRTARGGERRVRSMGELETRDGKPFAVTGVFQDITARYRMEQELRHSASRDDLTGLANRAWFNTVLDDAMAAARRQETPLALALLDLDRFKAVNDSCGHLAGDDVLRGLASRLGAEYLSGAFAARLGGDEFVLLFTGDAVHALESTLQRLSRDLQRLAVFDAEGITVSATIGAARLEPEVRDRSDLLHRADTALYAAKRTRRGTVRVHAKTASTGHAATG